MSNCKDRGATSHSRSMVEQGLESKKSSEAPKNCLVLPLTLRERPVGDTPCQIHQNEDEMSVQSGQYGSRQGGEGGTQPYMSIEGFI